MRARRVLPCSLAIGGFLVLAGRAFPQADPRAACGSDRAASSLPTAGR